MAYARTVNAAESGRGWEELFWLVFRRSANAIVLVDDRRVVVDVNEAGIALLGRGRVEIVGKPITEIIDPSEQQQSAQQWQAFLRSGEYSGTRELVRADGSTVEIDFAARLAEVGGRRLAIYVALLRTPPGHEPAPFPDGVLSAREREVVTLIALGLETNEIAAELHISPETVRTHVRNAMAKLHAHTRAQLVAIALCGDRLLHVPQTGESLLA